MSSPASHKFGSDLDEATKQQIERGQRLTELLKQPQYQPMGIWEQVVSVYVVSEGLFDEVVTAKIKAAQAELLTRLSGTTTKTTCAN